MICFLQEFGIESKFVVKEYVEGIFVFLNDVEIGSDVLVVLQFDDVIFELGLMLNCVDVMNMFGVVYEVVVILDIEVKFL